ncbi:MAG: hypothetical protein ACWA5R_11640 [bacterium]
MLEYIFFDNKPASEFENKMREMDVNYELEKDEDCYTFKLEEEQDCDFDAIEDVYEYFLDQNEAMYTEAHQDEFHAVGVLVTLASGEQVQAEVKPKLMNKIMQVLNGDELAEFIDSISSAVESQDTRTLCQQHREIKS